VVRRYVPDAGDVVWLDFNPQAGREQAGRRPALVLSPLLYNDKAGLAIACPITSKPKGYPFEVALPTNFKIAGVILSDHLKSIDWKERRAEYAATVSTQIMDAVRERVSALLGFR
jgi:mRNA interferase MazF